MRICDLGSSVELVVNATFVYLVCMQRAYEYIPVRSSIHVYRLLRYEGIIQTHCCRRKNNLPSDNILQGKGVKDLKLDTKERSRDKTTGRKEILENVNNRFSPL